MNNNSYIFYGTESEWTQNQSNFDFPYIAYTNDAGNVYISPFEGGGGGQQPEPVYQTFTYTRVFDNFKYLRDGSSNPAGLYAEFYFSFQDSAFSSASSVTRTANGWQLVYNTTSDTLTLSKQFTVDTTLTLQEQIASIDDTYTELYMGTQTSNGGAFYDNMGIELIWQGNTESGQYDLFIGNLQDAVSDYVAGLNALTNITIPAVGMDEMFEPDPNGSGTPFTTYYYSQIYYTGLNTIYDSTGVRQTSIPMRIVFNNNTEDITVGGNSNVFGDFNGISYTYIATGNDAGKLRLSFTFECDPVLTNAEKIALLSNTGYTLYYTGSNIYTQAGDEYQCDASSDSNGYMIGQFSEYDAFVSNSVFTESTQTYDIWDNFTQVQGGSEEPTYDFVYTINNLDKVYYDTGDTSDCDFELNSGEYQYRAACMKQQPIQIMFENSDGNSTPALITCDDDINYDYDANTNITYDTSTGTMTITMTGLTGGSERQYQIGYIDTSGGMVTYENEYGYSMNLRGRFTNDISWGNSEEIATYYDVNQDTTINANSGEGLWPTAFEVLDVDNYSMISVVTQSAATETQTGYAITIDFVDDLFVNNKGYLCIISNNNTDQYSDIQLTYTPMPGATVSNPRSVTLEYSFDGKTWQSKTFSTANNQYIRLSGLAQDAHGEYIQQRVYLRAPANSTLSSTGLNDFYYQYKFTTLNATGNESYNIEGNIMTLLYGATAITTPDQDIPAIYCFTRLFAGFEVSDASWLWLPSTVVTEGCYLSMFDNSSLQYPPQAIKLQYDMFSPAASVCRGMFRGTSITSTPYLVLDVLYTSQLMEMFQDCQYLDSVYIVSYGSEASGSTDTTTDWLENVAASGTVYYVDGDVSISDFTVNSDSGIPSGWITDNSLTV